MNDVGRVVGYGVTAEWPTEHAFLWEAGRGMRDLGPLPGYTYGAATGINNAGQVVGGGLRARHRAALAGLPLVGGGGDARAGGLDGGQ